MPSSTPAFTNSSLYLPMSVSSFSLGMTPASVFLSALTIIMNRMVTSPSGLGLRAGLSGRFGHVKLGCTDSRTRDSEIDSSNYLFGVYLIVGGALACYRGNGEDKRVLCPGSFFGGILAVVFFGDALTVQLCIAAALMGLGLWLHLSERHVHEHVHDAIEHTHSHRHDEHHQHSHAFEWDGAEPHSHPHLHEATVHRHAHFPDIHHRHRHG